VTTVQLDTRPLKRLAGVLAALIVLLAIYFGSIAVSLNGLVSAVRRADGAEVLARTNMVWVRQSLVDQVVGAYLKDRLANKQLTPFQRMAVGAVSSTIADELVGKLITAENLSVLLRTGAVQTASGPPVADGLSPITSLDSYRVFDLLKRLQLIKPVEVAIRLGSGKDDGAVHLHFESGAWKLSAIKLSPRAIKEILSRLPNAG
jgi:hypothetical protein